MKVQYKTNYVGEDLYYVTDKQPNRFFDISCFGTTNPNSAYELYQNPHGFHVFEYVVSGEGYIDYADKHIRVAAGDFYYLKQGFIGHYYASADDPYKKIWVNATGTMLDNLASTFNIDEPVLTSSLGEPLEVALRSLHSHLENCGSLSDSEVLRRCSVCAFEMLSMAAGSRLIEQSFYHIRFSENVKLYIKNNIYSAPELEDIADHFHMNPSHLIRRFKRETGITPMRYYNLCRIDAARSWLCMDYSTVKSIATRLRYSDSAYFSSCFKAETGVSPSDYTKEMHLAYLKSKGKKTSD